MNVSDFELTETERACGVTLADVVRERARALVRGGLVVVGDGVSPALAGAVARLALGCPVEFAGLTSSGFPRYVMAERLA